MSFVKTLMKDINRQLKKEINLSKYNDEDLISELRRRGYFIAPLNKVVDFFKEKKE